MRTTDLSHDLNELAEHMKANSKRWFPLLDHNEVFYTLGLVGEAGELANLIKKGIRSSWGVFSLEEVAAECADIFTYLLLLCNQLDIDIIGAYELKEQICEERWG